MTLLRNLMLCSLLISFLPGMGQKKERKKIKMSTEVLNDFSKNREGIPEKLFTTSQAIIIVPKLINAGFVVAGERGKGIAMVKDAKGLWSDPIFITLTGGSAGFQAGVEAVDLVLLFKKRETLQNFGKGSFTLGGDISVTAGPFGRSSTASTDYKLDAEVYSYSKSKGLFGGFSITGSSLIFDKKATKAFYGKEQTAMGIFQAKTHSSSAEVKEMLGVLNKLFK